MGCTPDYNWRDVKPDGAALAAMFPCRPEHHVRTVSLSEAIVAPMHLLVCRSARVTFAVGYLDVAAPADVSAALIALRMAAVANISGADGPTSPFVVPGMTPSAYAVAISARGRLADGAPIQSRMGFFVRGTRIYQATVFGPELDPEAMQTFFGSLRVQ
jgi:hypothetical protein